MKFLISLLLLGAILAAAFGFLSMETDSDGPQTTDQTTSPAAGQTDETFPETTAGDYNTASVDAEQVQKIQIDWVAGSITLRPDDTDSIVIRETDNPDRPMVWEVGSGVLSIRYAEYDLSVLDNLDAKNYKKDLIITVPQDWAGRKLVINAAAADVEMQALSVEDVEINCVSGRSKLERCTAREVSLATVSGDVRFTGSLEKLECSAVSADCTLRLTETPRDIELSSVSGKLDLSLPEDSGFRVEMTGARKKLETDFEVTGENGIYLCGDGSCQIEVNSVTSRVDINRD